MRLLLALLEGLRYLRAITPRWRLLPTTTYLHWRLGTVYGSFDRTTGAPRTVRAMLGDVWRDREQVLRFLTWRRELRRRAL